MLRPTSKCLHQASPGEFVEFIVAYLILLLAQWEARDRRGTAHGSAVPLHTFRDHGVAESVLLWMLYQAHVEHLELTPESPGAGCTVASVRFTESSAFCLTAEGEAYANQFVADALIPLSPDAFAAAWDALVLGTLLPSFDTEGRVFRWGRHIIKDFRQPAANQQLVLCTAQELQWPAWFDDPLLRRPGTSPKVRLHDTIKDLNRRQVPYLVHFKGDGTGMRVGWEYR
jgi:hypothetical protein